MPELMESPRRAIHSPGDRSRSRELELLLRDMSPVGSAENRKTFPPASQSAGEMPPLTDDPGHRGQCFSCGFHGQE